MESECAYEKGELVPVTQIDENKFCVEPDVYSEEGKEDLAKSALIRLLLIIIDADKPRLACYQLADSLNALALLGGITGTQIAKQFGVSKQDYEQGRERLSEKILVNCQTRRMKSSKASKSYSLSNYRKPKKQI